MILILSTGLYLIKYKIVELAELFWCCIQSGTWEAEDILIIF
jgi:hypothetical protein